MIQVSHLTRYYGDFPALQDVSFHAEKGEVIGLLGLNGAGKTTCLRVLAGLLAPSRGAVTIDGIDVVDAPDALKARIGFLPETPPQYTDMTVSSFLVYAGRLKGMPADRVAKRLPEVIATANLQGREHQVIGTLSHGFRKRVGIAQTIIHDPELVILDEPTSGLDPVQIVEMRKVIRRLAEGRAVLISSHNLPEISQTCDRIIVLHDGRLVKQGTEEEMTASLGDARIVVTVRGDQAAFEAWLGQHAKVEHFQPRPIAGPFASAMVDLEGDIRETWLRDVLDAGFGVRLVEVPDSELEEIFLGLTRDTVPDHTGGLDRGVSP